LLLLTVLSLAGASCSGDDDSPSPSSSDGPATTPDVDGGLLQTLEPVRLYGGAAGDQAGAIAAGDFNGDGDKDVVLAAAFADSPSGSGADAGAAYVFLGPFQPGEERDVADGDQALTINGPELETSWAIGDGW
jgi:hypothetical protein